MIYIIRVYIVRLVHESWFKIQSIYLKFLYNRRIIFYTSGMI